MVENQGYSVDVYLLAVNLTDRYLIHIAENGIEKIPNKMLMAATSVMLSAKINHKTAEISQIVNSESDRKR